MLPGPVCKEQYAGNAADSGSYIVQLDFQKSIYLHRSKKMKLRLFLLKYGFLSKFIFVQEAIWTDAVSFKCCSFII